MIGTRVRVQVADPHGPEMHTTDATVVATAAQPGAQEYPGQGRPWYGLLQLDGNGGFVTFDLTEVKPIITVPADSHQLQLQLDAANDEAAQLTADLAAARKRIAELEAATKRRGKASESGSST